MKIIQHVPDKPMGQWRSLKGTENNFLRQMKMEVQHTKLMGYRKNILRGKLISINVHVEKQ